MGILDYDLSAYAYNKKRIMLEIKLIRIDDDDECF
jgi:hypothetical protein